MLAIEHADLEFREVNYYGYLGQGVELSVMQLSACVAIPIIYIARWNLLEYQLTVYYRHVLEGRN